MKLFRTFAIAALAMISGSSAEAGVYLFGNIPTSGTGITGGSNSTIQNANTRSALGFTVGANSVTVDEVRLILDVDSAQYPGASDSFAMGLGIYGNASGVPNLSSSLGTASATVTTAKSNVLFSFGNGVVLSANTTYWIVPDTPGAKWYTSTAPTAQSSSGITYVFSQDGSTFSSPTWTDIGSNMTVALFGSVNNSEVPEPALTSLLCLGGVALIRRRMKK